MRGARYVLEVERDGEVMDSDDEGVPVVPTLRRRQVRGSLTMLSAREVLRAQVYGEDLEAAAHLPVGDPIDRRERVVLRRALNPAGVPAQLEGSWTVGAVVVRPSLVRALLRRNPISEDD